MAYKRKTADEYTVQGFYCNGWEDLTTEETRREAKERLKEYRENAPGVYRLVKRRVKIAE